MVSIPDIRDLIKAEMHRRKTNHVKAGMELFRSSTYLTNMLNGCAKVSFTQFSKLTSSWEIAKSPRILRIWIASFILDRYGMEMLRLFRVAGWYPGDEDVDALERREGQVIRKWD